MCSAEHGHTVRVEDHAGRGFVGPGEVVQVLPVGIATGVCHLFVLFHADHQTLVADRLDIVLIAVGRLVQRPLSGGGHGTHDTHCNDTL